MSEVFTKRLALLGMILALLIAPFTAFAQSTTDGAIGGTIVDQSKAVIPGAKIAILNIGTNDKQAATADNEGKFRVIRLQPGTYTVTVDAASFSPYKHSGVIVEVGRVTELEITLTTGTKSETVEVTGEAPSVNTVQQDFSHNINQTTINELPINGRRWSNFALLTPGATPDGAFGLISFRGISGLLNNNTVDGGDNNQAFFAEERGRTRISYVTSQNSVREFQVNTSNFSAEYGRAAGAVVNAVTKSGTNNFHGQVFYYIRDNELGATNPSTFASVKQPDGSFAQVAFKPDDRRQQFGGNIGGPIIKDKLFFFFNYDQQKRNYPGAAQPGSGSFFNAPTAAEITALNAKFPLMTPAQAATAAQATIDYLASLTGTVPRNGDQTIFFPKLDWKINSNNTMALSYNRMRWKAPAGVQSQASVNRGLASWGDDGVKVDSFIARISSAIGNNISNEFRFQYGRDFEFQAAQTPLSQEPKTSPTGLAPSVAVGGTDGLTFGTPNFLNRFAYPDELRWQFADSASWAHGKHLLKFGTDINKVSDILNNLFQQNGAYSYNNRGTFMIDYTALQQGLTGAAYRNYSSFNQGFGTTRFDFDTWDLSWFIQDDWRILPRLTLNLGLRYEYQVLPHAQVPNPNLPSSYNFRGDDNNLGPRVGFAWDVFGNGKTSLRGGWGIYYGRVINSTLANAITNTGNSGGQLQYSYNTGNGPQYPFTTSPLATVRPDVIYLASNLQNPKIQQVDVVLEREIGFKTTVSVSYLGSFGDNLVLFVDKNLPAPTVVNYVVTGGGPFDGKTGTMNMYRTARPNTSFGGMTEVSSSVTSNYNALVAQVNRRFSGGLQFSSSFTWAHALDSGQNSVTFTQRQSPLDPNNLAAESGSSSFDMRKRFIATVIWSPEYFKNSGKMMKALLDNWSLSPIIQVASGRPLTEFVGTSGLGTTTSTGPNGSGTSNARAPFISRNFWRYPSTTLVDLRVQKGINIKEGQKLNLMLEAFNLFNHRNVTNLNDRLYTASGTGSTITFTNYTVAPFMTPTTTGYNNNTIFRERQVQVAVRYDF